MRKKKAQYFIRGRSITKKEFLNRRDDEVETAYVYQQYLLENKIFSLAKIRAYEKRGLLPSTRHRGKKCFKKEDVLMLGKAEKEKGSKFFIVPQTDEEIERNRKIIEELRARGELQKYEKTFKLNEDGTITQEDGVIL